MPSDSSSGNKNWLGHEREMLRGYDEVAVDPWSRMDAARILADVTVSLRQRLETITWPGVVVSPELRELAKWIEPEPEIRKRGHPAVRRAPAVDILDLMRSEKLSRAAATRKLCDCGKKKHDESCVDRMRAPIRKLQKLLKLHDIPL